LTTGPKKGTFFCPVYARFIINVVDIVLSKSVPKGEKLFKKALDSLQSKS